MFNQSMFSEVKAVLTASLAAVFPDKFDENDSNVFRVNNNPNYHMKRESFKIVKIPLQLQCFTPS